MYVVPAFEFVDDPGDSYPDNFYPGNKSELIQLWKKEVQPHRKIQPLIWWELPGWNTNLFVVWLAICKENDEARQAGNKTNPIPLSFFQDWSVPVFLITISCLQVNVNQQKLNKISGICFQKYTMLQTLTPGQSQLQFMRYFSIFI